MWTRSSLDNFLATKTDIFFSLRSVNVTPLAFYPSVCICARRGVNEQCHIYDALCILKWRKKQRPRRNFRKFISFLSNPDWRFRLSAKNPVSFRYDDVGITIILRRFRRRDLEEGSSKTRWWKIRMSLPLTADVDCWGCSSSISSPTASSGGGWVVSSHCQ